MLTAGSAVRVDGQVRQVTCVDVELGVPAGHVVDAAGEPVQLSSVADPPRRTLKRTARTPAASRREISSSVTVAGTWVTPT